jgi:hypothetical protein
MKLAAALLPLALAAASPAWASRPWPPAPYAAGSLVSVQVQVEGAATPLYAAVDGSGRYYVQARQGARYTVRLENRSGERLAVRMTVDGLNVISGDRQTVDQSGRMYVLDPWESADIQGWRTSLDDVRRFTFVDERASYAARSGQANSRMGWIELAVYRERHRYGWRPPERPDVTAREGRREPSAPADAPAPRASGDEAARDRSASKSGHPQAGAVESYPGTGWGERTHDPVRLVDFEPESWPAERITLRYEYAAALRALGILPWQATRDRLEERDSGGGFAKPPRW